MIYISKRDADYFTVGSIGFAQVGDPEYYEKNKIEMQVLLNYIKKKHPVPEKFQHMCYYKTMSFPHDFGSYHEIVIYYNRSITDDWELELDDDTISGEINPHDEFWDFVNESERFFCDNEVLLFELVKCEYMKHVEMEKVRKDGKDPENMDNYSPSKKPIWTVIKTLQLELFSENENSTETA